MCGLAGFSGPGDAQDLGAMSAALVHRGPDDKGEYVCPDARVFLAHRRLAVIDIAGGAQPMSNEDATVQVLFNGEIYNFQDLRRELEAKGHVFRSHHSDTEVLVHGYEEWGRDLPNRLNGMFAFAVYDRPRRRFFLARDRFGKKPLYYHHRGSLFAFASELGALRRHREVKTVLDQRALQKFFAYGYVPAPLSLYRDTYKLPGGHSLTFDIAAGRIELRRYWRFAIEPFERIPRDAEQVWGEELRHLLSEAVKRRLVSDVPLGIFLSGGIDSSAILAMAADHVPAEQIKTFSIGFNEPSFDESAFAREAAGLVGCNHHEETLDMDRAMAMIPGILGRLDEPMADPSIIPTYLLCRFAREHVTVALGGDGGDELFAGYDPFKALGLAKLYRKCVPGPVHGLVRALVNRIPRSGANMSLDFRLRRALAGVSHPAKLWNPVWLGPLEPDRIGDMFGQRIDVEDLYSEAIALWNEATGEGVVDRTLDFYTNLYLQNDILTKTDRASMMVSLELRSPFLDLDLVDFARRIPHRFKYRHGETKYLLKKALATVLPSSIIDRPKKGFGIPLASWLRQVPDAHRPLPGLGIDQSWVDRRWAGHLSGAEDNRAFLWCWVVLQHHLGPARARAAA